jgi:hypothetical protein
MKELNIRGLRGPSWYRIEKMVCCVIPARGGENNMPGEQVEETFDFVVIGSGFGGSVAAMRLPENILLTGKRFYVLIMRLRAACWE